MQYSKDDFKAKLLKLRDLICPNFTDHRANSFAEQLCRKMSFDVFRKACSHFADNFEPKPYAQFPNVKDFIDFQPTDNEDTWFTKKYRKLGRPWNMTWQEAREYEDYVLEYAAILKMHPSKMPDDARYLTVSQRNKCGILERNDGEQAFKIILDGLMGKYRTTKGV